MRISNNLEVGAMPSPSFKKPKIYIAVPCYSGDLCFQHHISMIKTILLLFKNGIEVVHKLAIHKTHALARNELVNDFLKSDCTHILFIDDDQGWDAQKILDMINENEMFICGAIRYKQDFEEYPLLCDVKQDMSFNYGKNKNLIKAHQIGVALALLKRELFDLVRSANVLKYLNGLGYEYFELYNKNGCYQGEDNDFCEKVRKANIPIYIYANFDTIHVGKKEYKANFDTYLRNLPGGDLYLKATNLKID
jgi:hypothetical protein